MNNGNYVEPIPALRELSRRTVDFYRLPSDTNVQQYEKTVASVHLLRELDDLPQDIKLDHSAKVHYFKARVLNSFPFRSKDAENWIGEAIRIEPGVVEHWLQLSITLSKEPQGLRRALGMIEAALIITPNSLPLTRQMNYLREKVNAWEGMLEEPKEPMRCICGAIRYEIPAFTAQNWERLFLRCGLYQNGVAHCPSFDWVDELPP